MFLLEVGGFMLIGLKQMLAGKKWNIGMVQNLQLSSHTH
jgi:hypothetical protein